MDALREGSGGLPDGVAEDYWRKFEASYRVDCGGSPRVFHSEVVVTTPEVWANRPESSDPTWVVRRDAMPLVVATRFTG